MSVFFTLILSAGLLCASPKAAPQFVPGEILAKFAPGTDGSAAVARASQVSPPDLGPLVPAIKPLEASTGIPLMATQVIGGNWVVLSVDSDRLTDQVVRQLRTRKNVADVKVSPERADTPLGLSLPRSLIIRFVPGSPESEAVRQKLADAGDGRFAQLIHDLEKYLDLPLNGEVTEQDKVLMQIDSKALTPILVERLKALSDIESAQLNYIATIQMQ